MTGATPPETREERVMALAERARVEGIEAVSPVRLHRECAGDKDLYIKAMLAAGFIRGRGATPPERRKD